MNIKDRRKDIRKHKTKKPTYRNLSVIEGIAIHHSLTTTGSADAFANYHIGTNDWSVMGYHYVINQNGVIEFCSDWNVVTPQVGNHNKKYIGICLVGDFRKQKPTAEQYKSLYELVPYLMSKLDISLNKVIGHQELSGYEWKQCPALNMDQLRGHIKNKTYGEVQNNYNNDKKILIANSPYSAPVKDYLEKNDKGALVSKLQENLNKLGYSVGKVDGVYGNLTENAIVSLQKNNGLGVDGIAGKNTLAKIDELVTQLNKPKQEVKTKEEKLSEVMKMKMSEFVNAHNMKQLEEVYKQARENGLLTDDRWELAAKNNTLTVGDVAFLATILDDRRHDKCCKCCK